MGADYIPERNERAATYIRWFARALVNDPVAYRTTPGHAADIEALALAFYEANHANVMALQSGVQSRELSTTMRQTRKAAEKLVRPEAQRIRTDPKIEGALKVRIGLKVNRKRRRHVGPPAGRPRLSAPRVEINQIYLRVRDSESPYRNALPDGAAFYEVYERVHSLEASNGIATKNENPQWQYLGCFSRPAVIICSSAQKSGQRVDLVARWMSRTCEPGAYGYPITLNVRVDPGAPSRAQFRNRPAA